MNAHSRRRPATLLVAASVVTLAVAGPAFADNVGVTLSSTDGSRQFAVKNAAGTADLTSINLGTGGEQAFRPVVKDVNKKVVSGGYQVTAEMTNLYLQTSGASTPLDASDDAYSYSTKIPAKDLSIRYNASPLGVTGLSLPVVPSLDITGTLASCADATTIADLNISVGNPLTTLCTALAGLTAGNATLAAGEATVNGLPQVLTNGIALSDLPFALTGAAETGAFTNASYATGSLGAGDTAGKAADAGKTTTTKRIMTGTASFTAGLQASLTTALTNALNGVPLTAADGVSGRATVDAVYAALNTNPALVTVTTELAKLPLADQVAYLNRLVSTLNPITQAVLSSISAEYHAMPVLASSPTTSAAGTYGGTLVVTFLDGV